MARYGTAAGVVSFLWVGHALAPADTLDCPPAVMETTMALIEARDRAEAARAARRAREETTGRMLRVLHGGKG